MGMIDVGQINDLAEKLATVPARKHVLVAAAVKHGAQNIKESVTADLESSEHKGFRKIQIGYELKGHDAIVEADIGPRQNRASHLANIAFFGTSRGGGGHKFYEHGKDELEPTAKYVREAASTL